MGFHCLVTEVKPICHLPGEAASGAALQGWLGVQEDAASRSRKRQMPVAFRNGPVYPGVLWGASSLDRCGDGFSSSLGILERMLGFQQAPRSGEQVTTGFMGDFEQGENLLINHTVVYLIAYRPLQPFGI